MNILHKSLILAALATAAVGFTSCSDDDKDKMPAAFTVSEKDFSVKYDGLNADGDLAMFSLAATSPWAVTKADEWLSVSQSSGDAGTYNIFITAQELTSADDRRGFIELAMGNMKHLLTVNQSRKTIELSLSTTGVALNVLGKDSEGAIPTVHLTANNDWTIETDCDWLKATPAQGAQGEADITIEAAVNKTGAQRTGKVNVKAMDMTRSITVVQDWQAFTADKNVTDILLPATDATYTVNLGCIEAWKVTAKPAWLTVTPDNGPAGTTEVTLSAADNDADPLKGTVELESASGVGITVNVSQSTTRLAFDDKAVGYAYFSDDMAWAVGGQDQVGSVNGSAGTTRNIYTYNFAGDGLHDVLAAFQSRYTDMNASGKTVYAADGYIKFGMGSKQTAFMIKEPLGIPSGCKANVAVTFRAAKNGTDKITMSVAIQGPGKIEGAVNDEGTLSAPCDPINNSDKTINWQWKEFTVNISGVTSDTKIVIGETQFIIDGFKTRSGYFRGFIDDIAVKRIAND